MIKLHLHGQIIVGLVLALLWAILFTLLNTASPLDNIGLEPNQTGTEHVSPIETTKTPKQQPFTTLPDVMMVRVRINQGSLPEIVRVISLPEGRLNVSEDGNSALRLVSEGNQVLHEIRFTPNFYFGDPPLEHDSVEMIFVLPTIVEAYQLELSTPYGDDYHEFN
jgi:glucose/arabinose dehydrogenase